MKKVLFYAAVIAATILSLPGCNQNQTPAMDLTKLWPAADVTTGMMGYIDMSGNFKIPAVYDEASNFFSCGYAWARIGSMEYYIDKSGNVKYISERSLSPFYYNYASVVDNNNRCGLLNRSFKYSIFPVFGYLGNMSYEGLIPAALAGGRSLGYVDVKGNIKIDTAYVEAKGFVDGYAPVAIMDNNIKKWGLIDKNGTYTIEPSYLNIVALGHNRWAALNEGTCSMIDAKGDVKGDYYGIIGSIDGEDLYCVRNDARKWGVVDQDGKEVIAYKYDSLGAFCQGMAAAITYDNDKKTYTGNIIDSKGNVLFSETADNWIAKSPMHNGLILITTQEDDKITAKWIDKNGKVIYSWTPTPNGLELIVEDLSGWDKFILPQRAPKAENETYEWAPEPFYVVK